jgi:hypothetical protein
VRVLHLLDSDSAVYRRGTYMHPTWCQRWVSPRELATHVDFVTCAECLHAYDTFCDAEV